ncbi:MAG TPA: hypothetical protein VN455_12935, partial [Methanotrichaceae archaeon]|nr:hypothetical protein [Methanotrichaceae archaeon]
VISTAGMELIMRKGGFLRIGCQEVDRGQHDSAKIVDYIEGACLLIRRPVLDEIGLLDSGYFAYWEETDLCLRGLDAGYKSICVPSAKIWHKVSSSASSGVKLYYMTRNRLWLLRDHATEQELRSFLTYFLVQQFWIDILTYLRRKDLSSLSIFLRGVFHGMLPRNKLGRI